MMQQKIVICGATGLIGQALSGFFKSLGWEVCVIGRADLLQPPGHISGIMQGSKALINLAGSPVIKPWTKRNMKEMRVSRIQTTRTLVDALKDMEVPPEVFLSTSAIGIYPDAGSHDETSAARDQGFLGQLCQDWEEAALQAPAECRIVLMRFGIVLDPKKGALAKMLPLFRMGLGGKIGSGRQHFSWIHVQDVLEAVKFILDHKEICGPVNFCSPECANNLTFTRKLASAVGRPAWLRVPGLALKLIYGKGASNLLKGQHAIPSKLIQHGFRFSYPQLDQALKHLLSRKA